MGGGSSVSSFLHRGVLLPGSHKKFSIPTHTDKRHTEANVLEETCARMFTAAFRCQPKREIFLRCPSIGKRTDKHGRSNVLSKSQEMLPDAFSEAKKAEVVQKPIIPARESERLSQEEDEFEVRLSYTMNSRLARIT